LRYDLMLKCLYLGLSHPVLFFHYGSCHEFLCNLVHYSPLGFQEAVDDVIPLASQSKQKTRTTVECETMIQLESALLPVTERSQNVTCHVNSGASDQKDYHKTPKSNLENSELVAKKFMTCTIMKKQYRIRNTQR
jgi:hypothetical protein